MSEHEFSYLCCGSEKAPHALLTDHRLGLSAPPAVPACSKCGEPMKLIQSEFGRKLTDQIRRGA